MYRICFQLSADLSLSVQIRHSTRSVQKAKAHQEECITKITSKNELYIHCQCKESYMFWFPNSQNKLGKKLYF